MRFYITRRKLRLCPPNFASSHQCFLKLRNGILHSLFQRIHILSLANNQIIQRYSKEFRKQNHVIIRCRYYSALNLWNAFCININRLSQSLLRIPFWFAQLLNSCSTYMLIVIHTFLLPHSRYRTGPAEGQKRSRMTVKKKSCADKTEHGYPIILSHAAFGRLRLSAAPQHSYDL